MMHRPLSVTFRISILVLVALTLASAAGADAQQKTMPFPKVTIDIGKAAKPEDVSVTLQILFLMTILSLAPAILILTTAFTRIIVVFHFLKQAMGTPQMPPSQVLIGLAMFLTFFVMAPSWNKVNEQALQPYLNGKMNIQQAYDKGVVPLRDFMFRQTREEDLALFVKMTNGQKPRTRDDIPTTALIPAFAISELKTGFQIGFVLFVPFIIIDMVVSSILMSMGMMMLPPMMISLPFKILLFVMVDGWHLLVKSLLASFN
jgi:flagellar biosynthesis protein FliP